MGAEQLLSRFSWEAPQTALGFGVAQVNNEIGNVKSVHYKEGATVVENRTKDWGGFTIGSYIEVNRDPTSDLLEHEYGHTIQSQILGPLYLPFVALPSLASATIYPNDHAGYWAETWADQLTGWYHNDDNFQERYQQEDGFDPSQSSCAKFIIEDFLCSL